jgi:hypothetical protein
MVVTSNHLTFEQRYGDPTATHVGLSDEDVRGAYRVIYSERRVEDAPHTVEALEEEILTEFMAPIEEVGIMVARKDSSTWKLILLHGFDRYSGAPGKDNADRRTNFCFELNVDGQDVYTLAVKKNSWV